MKKTYIDERGWQYAVRPGLGGDIFKAFYRKPGRSWQRNSCIGIFNSRRWKRMTDREKEIVVNNLTIRAAKYAQAIYEKDLDLSASNYIQFRAVLGLAIDLGVVPDTATGKKMLNDAVKAWRDGQEAVK